MRKVVVVVVFFFFAFFFFAFFFVFLFFFGIYAKRKALEHTNEAIKYNQELCNALSYVYSKIYIA